MSKVDEVGQVEFGVSILEPFLSGKLSFHSHFYFYFSMLTVNLPL